MIDTIPFGKTGHQSSRTIFGAVSLWNVSQYDADRTLDLLWEFGVNHIDTAPSYGEPIFRLILTVLTRPLHQVPGRQKLVD